MFGLTRWSSFGSAFQLHREIDDLFSRFLGETWGDPASGRTHEAAVAWWPALESYEKDGKVHVRVALPGVDPEDVEVTVSDDLLVIKGERKTDQERKDGGYFRREFAYGAFERTLTLPPGVDPGQVQARYANGMLELTLPAPLAVAPKRVEIAVESETPGTKAAKAA